MPEVILGEGFDLSGLLDEFRDEGRGQLDLLDGALLQLEREGGLAREDRAALLRALHTLKGNSGMLGVAAVRDYVHAVETVFKDPPDAWPQPLLDRLFEGAAALRQAVDRLGTEREGEAMERLSRLPPPDAAPAPPSGSAAPHPPAAPIAGTARVDSAPPPDEISSPEPAAEPDAEPTGPTVQSEILRIPFPKLDTLLNLVGELVAAHASLDDLIVENRGALEEIGLRRPLLARAEQVERAAAALRSAAMDLRLVPVSRVFRRFPSLARELAREQGKQITVVLEGEDTELDKSTVDALGEPLLHLVRNAVDHGIRTPAEREAAGRPPAGTLVLRAMQSGDRVRVEVEDDGEGLDRARILERARSVGLVGPGETPSGPELADLIFRPGFSTRREADTVSGRGIGLDVVAESVSALRGSIEVDDAPGAGTRFLLHLPLTLAVVPVLLFEADDEIFALPALEVEDTLRPARVVRAAGAEVVPHEEELLPLARLARLFGWAPPASVDGGGSGAEAGMEEADAVPRYVVVVRRGTRSAAIAADRLLSQRDAVIKALPAFFEKPRGVSGATIAPDGRLVLLLDAGELIDLNLDSHRKATRDPNARQDPDRRG